MINGIPCKVKTPDKDGNLTNVETFYFATFRKCPELAKFPKDMIKLETKQKKLKRMLELAENELNCAENEEDIDKAIAKIDSLQEDLNKGDDVLLKKFQGFISGGMKAAGYKEEDIEYYSAFIDYDKFPELLSKAKLGAGRVDFF